MISFLAVASSAEEIKAPENRFLKADLIGYLAITKRHSTETITDLLKEHAADRVSRFVVSGYAQGVQSVVYTIVERPKETWVEISWILDARKTPKVYRTQLLKGDSSAWTHALEKLNHEKLQSVDDKKGKGTLDGRSIWLAVKSKNEQFEYGFPNPSYAELPGLQSIRFVDLLVTDWSKHSFGPAMYDYAPNPGTIPLQNQGEQERLSNPLPLPSRNDHL